MTRVRSEILGAEILQTQTEAKVFQHRTDFLQAMGVEFEVLPMVEKAAGRGNRLPEPRDAGLPELFHHSGKFGQSASEPLVVDPHARGQPCRVTPSLSSCEPNGSTD